MYVLWWLFMPKVMRDDMRNSGLQRTETTNIKYCKCYYQHNDLLENFI